MKLKHHHPTPSFHADDATIHTNNSNFPLFDNTSCPLHPGDKHTWGDCHQYQYGVLQQGLLTFGVTPHASDSQVQDPHLEVEDTASELLQLHHYLGHMSLLGEIPKKLATTTPPKCAG